MTRNQSDEPRDRIRGKQSLSGIEQQSLTSGSESVNPIVSDVWDKIAWRGVYLMKTQPDQKGTEILVVDDHAESLFFMERALTLLGWSVITASNAREVLDKLKYTKPDLILMDMRLPQMDGFELTRILKNDPAYRDILILAITALNTAETRTRCLEAGCEDFLSKPFRIPDLDNRMRRLLGKQES